MKLLPFVLAFLLTLCLSAPIRADEVADRTAIEAAAQAWTQALNARDVDRMAALMTHDIVLLDPSLPSISGEKAARQALAGGKAQFTTTTKELVIAGDSAWRIGALTSKMPGGTLATTTSHSLEIWKRVNGAWRLHRQMSGVLTAPRTFRRPLPTEPVLDTP